MSEIGLVETYMDLVTRRSLGTTPQNVFAVPRDLYSDSGILSREEENVILIYPGAFNPPHLGHFGVLKSGFIEGVGDLRISAAIVVILANTYIRYKNQQAGETFVVTQQDRAELWRSHPGHKTQTWIYAAEDDFWDGFANRLVMEARRDGFHIRFAQLMGTDHLEPDKPLPTPSSLLAAQIVTDAARKSEMFCKERRDQLRGYSPWQLLQERGEEGNIWCCHPISTRSFHVYLVLSHHETGHFSSTRLRKALSEKEGEPLVKELRTMTLSPWALVSMIQTGQVQMEEKEKAKLQADDKLQGLNPSMGAGKEEA